MNPTAALSLFAAAFCFGLAVFVLAKNRRSFSNRVFFTGMILLAIQELVSAIEYDLMFGAEVLRLHRLEWSIGAFVPGVWLLFGLSYARSNYRDFLRRWRWILVLLFLVPSLLITVGVDDIFEDAVLDTGGWRLPVGWTGSALVLFRLFASVLILMSLESTLRASTGVKRWKIKFTLLGIATFFAVQIYQSSQTLLYSSLYTAYSSLDSATLIVAGVLVSLSLWRSKAVQIDLYFSDTAIHRSLTLLIVGIYLLVVGGIARGVLVVGGTWSVPIATFIAFLAITVLTVALLSDEAQLRFKAIIGRHLRRPKYDHRQIWRSFTRHTGAVLDIESLSTAMVKFASETFGVGSASLWLSNDARDRLTLAASTALAGERARELIRAAGNGKLLVDIMCEQEGPLDLDAFSSRTKGGRAGLTADFLRELQIRFGISLVAGEQFLGLLTLSARVTKEPFTTEDFDLLKSIADETAAHMLNLRLSEQLFLAKQMEAFQTLSAFFVHDLKNLASRLSLTMQNFPVHYDDPTFRKDMQRTIQQSVDKIDNMTRRLSPLSQRAETFRTFVDVNELVADTLADLRSSCKTQLIQDLEPVDRAYVDPDGFRAVLTNLVMNADEAVAKNAKNAKTYVGVDQQGDWLVLSVRDEGPGMLPEFIDRSLFRPFQTTKKKGLGIGLYHCKTIVAAHNGCIDVESRLGAGSIFRVKLPLGDSHPIRDDDLTKKELKKNQ